MNENNKKKVIKTAKNAKILRWVACVVFNSYKWKKFTKQNLQNIWNFKVLGQLKNSWNNWKVNDFCKTSFRMINNE